MLQCLGKNASKFQVVQALTIALGLESGFIGDWCFCDGVENAYNISWTSFIDRRLLENFSTLKPAKDRDDEDTHQILRFKFSLAPQNEIIFHCLESGDLLIFSVVHSLFPDSSITSTRSLAISMNRYFVTSKLNPVNFPNCFRNLRELSVKVKNELFLPIRNDIFSKSSCKSIYPSLHGIPDDCILLIFKYLKLKDVISLGKSCKSIHEKSVPYLLSQRLKNK